MVHSLWDVLATITDSKLTQGIIYDKIMLSNKQKYEKSLPNIDLTSQY
jgi:hypothetical protein